MVPPLVGVGPALQPPSGVAQPSMAPPVHVHEWVCGDPRLCPSSWVITSVDQLYVGVATLEL